MTSRCWTCDYDADPFDPEVPLTCARCERREDLEQRLAAMRRALTEFVQRGAEDSLLAIVRAAIRELAEEYQALEPPLADDEDQEHDEYAEYEAQVRADYERGAAGGAS